MFRGTAAQNVCREDLPKLRRLSHNDSSVSGRSYLLVGLRSPHGRSMSHCDCPVLLLRPPVGRYRRDDVADPAEKPPAADPETRGDYQPEEPAQKVPVV